MKQAWHIFNKDVRYLRWGIGCLLLFCVFYATTWGIGWPASGLELAAVGLLARAIQADPIPGDRQFWLTRPYRPMSLCGAKLIFLLACVNLPIGLAQLAVVLRLRFPLGQEILGLLGTQVLILGAGLMVAAVAATTTSPPPFVAVIAVLLVAVSAVGAAWPQQDQRFLHIPPQVEWMGSLTLFVVLSLTGVLIVLWQYRNRRTLLSRIVGISVFAVAFGLYFWIPAQWPLNAETLLSVQPALAANARVTLDMAQRSAQASEQWWSMRSEPTKVMVIDVPLAVTGLPPGLDTLADYVSLSFSWADRNWSPELKPGEAHRSSDLGTSLVDTVVPVDLDLYKVHRQMPVTIRGTLYLTIFGDPEKRKIALRNGPANAQDGLQCLIGDTFGRDRETFLCRSLFRWPSRLVRGEGPNAASDISVSAPSYSPLPVEMDLGMVAYHWGAPNPANEATIVTTRPLAHFRRDFELTGIRLADFEKDVHRWSPTDAIK
jgi:hypothetical protein